MQGTTHDAAIIVDEMRSVVVHVTILFKDAMKSLPPCYIWALQFAVVIPTEQHLAPQLRQCLEKRILSSILQQQDLAGRDPKEQGGRELLMAKDETIVWKSLWDFSSQSLEQHPVVIVVAVKQVYEQPLEKAIASSVAQQLVARSALWRCPQCVSVEVRSGATVKMGLQVQT